MLQNKYVSLVGYADYVTILVRCLGFVVETDLELDTIRYIKLRFSTSETEVLTQTCRNRTVASEVPTKEHRIEDVSNCICLGSYNTKSCGGCLGTKSDC